MRVRRWPRWARIGRTRSTSSSWPPAMIARVPASAPGVPPDTGASIQRMPVRDSSSAAISRVAAGSRLEKSTSNWPGRAPSMMPPSPNTTLRTTRVSARQSMTISASAQSSAGVFTQRAPCSTRETHFSGDRFHTVSGKPAASRRRVIGRPIRPIPAKAMEGNESVMPGLRAIGETHILNACSAT
ncbi:hypothetical protein D3C84_784910 [compost metagenome]